MDYWLAAGSANATAALFLFFAAAEAWKKEEKFLHSFKCCCRDWNETNNPNGLILPLPNSVDRRLERSPPILFCSQTLLVFAFLSPPTANLMHRLNFERRKKRGCEKMLFFAPLSAGVDLSLFRILRASGQQLVTGGPWGIKTQQEGWLTSVRGNKMTRKNGGQIIWTPRKTAARHHL